MLTGLSSYEEGSVMANNQFQAVEFLTSMF